MKKVITRIKGGIGNQLFCYAVARRLAIQNQAELVIDNKTGFIRDATYQRQYALEPFNIKSRKSTAWERMEPFERYRRAIAKLLAKLSSFSTRKYLEQEGLEFDERLLTYSVQNSVYLDGLWFSEKYFEDVEQTIRDDLRIIPPEDLVNQKIAKNINACNAIAVHIRWFDDPASKKASHNASTKYYKRALEYFEQREDVPHFFVFSDNPAAAQEKIPFPSNRTTFVSHNKEEEMAYADLWLMSQCKHFIIANSTFSWWGAWLADNKSKVVVSPDFNLVGITAWGFVGLLPEEWITL